MLSHGFIDPSRELREVVRKARVEKGSAYGSLVAASPALPSRFSGVGGVDVKGDLVVPGLLAEPRRALAVVELEDRPVLVVVGLHAVKFRPERRDPLRDDGRPTG